MNEEGELIGQVRIQRFDQAVYLDRKFILKE